MRPEYKELLLRDLCNRLPYGVKVEYNNSACEVLSIDKYNEELTIWKGTGYNIDVKLENVKPYLFPISSMTKEQKKEYAHILVMSSNIAYIQAFGMTVDDWLNKNNFDYRGLIPMGLALDATGKNIY